MDDDILLEEESGFSQDQRAEFLLGALVCVVVALLLAMLVFVFHEAWPSFSHNGLGWFGAGGSVDSQIQAIFTAGDFKQAAVYTFHAWPLIWSTILTTGAAVVIAFVSSLFVAVFIVEFAPVRLRRVLEPVVRLLASVPSVIYGLVGVLVLVPFIGNDLITEHEKSSVTPTIQLSGSSLLAAVLILTVMIAPIMIAVQFLSTATSRARSAGSSARPANARRRRSFSLGTAAVLAAIPVAVAVGVLVGRSPNDNNAKVLAALKQQKPTVVTVNGAGSGSGGATAAASTSGSGSGSAANASTPVASLNSDFSLPSGYTVELQTLPRAGTTAGTVTAAERSERAKGATAVGLIVPADFHLTPSPPAGAYVIFSGQYKTHAAATAAFAKLKGKFSGAKVIAVTSTAAGGSSTKVVAHTNFGAAHQVDGFKPTSKQLSSGAQIVKRESKQINNNYVQAQKGLPDSVSVP